MKKRLGATMVVSALTIYGCGGATEPESGDIAQPDMQAIQEATLMAPTVAPEVSINALMVSSIDHAAHVIWEVDSETPVTDDDWLELEYHAIQLTAMGTMISLGGSGPADAGWARLPAWEQYAQEITDIGVSVLQASRNKYVDGVIAAGDDLVDACENCHQEFKPELPTEGLVHTPHYPR